MPSHERALCQVVKYHSTMADRGIFYEPDPNLGIQYFVDADFDGSWSKADADNPENVMLHTGFVTMYAGYPVLWQTIRKVIPFINLLKELSKVFDLHMSKPEIHCKDFEDNESCTGIAKLYKFSHRTKHIALKYNNFRKFVTDGKLVILPISTKEHMADIFTKPL
eukprot:8329566-Ditylum_brightwellii.AAC.1